MTETLGDILKHQIDMSGPLDVGQFMTLALSHPQHGYYMKKDPFGAGGDFTTAPEISQMFGEMIGAWVADVWMQMGRPGEFVLLECGPGRGTLMADMLRATKKIESFHGACAAHLLETSPALKEKQAAALKDYNPHWHETLESVPADAPIIVIGNEFLDALPVRQFEKQDGQWSERIIVANDSPGFGLRPAPPEVQALIPDHVTEGVFEVSPAREGFVKNICGLLKKATGAALFIDYGHAHTAAGDTLQAVYKHEYVPVLEHIGEADLTSHVDFEALIRAALAEGATAHGPVTQGEFLQALGIEIRAHSLMSHADTAQKKDIENSLHRLTASDQMGTLFKVMGLSYGASVEPGGF